MAGTPFPACQPALRIAPRPRFGGSRDMGFGVRMPVCRDGASMAQLTGRLGFGRSRGWPVASRRSGRTGTLTCVPSHAQMPGIHRE